MTIQKMIAEAHIDKKTQMIRVKGNYGGQVVGVILLHMALIGLSWT